MSKPKITLSVRIVQWPALFVAVAVLTAACSPSERESATADADAAPTLNTLSAAEQEEGWMLLFDGESMQGWTGLGRGEVPEGHWRVENGTIRKVASGDVPTAADGQPLEGGDIMTEQTFSDFDLSFEWRVAEGANSGIKYNVSESLSTAHEPRYAALGFEYQVLDDLRHPDAELPSHRAAALYDMIAPSDAKQLRPVGEWNHSRIVFEGPHGEHWLNGTKVVEYDLTTPRFDSMLAASKYSDIEGFAERRNGHIVLQDHGDDVWFRNIKIKPSPTQ